MPKKEGFKPNLDSIWKEEKGKPGGRVEVGLRELIEAGIDKSLALNKIKGVQWTEIDPAELRDHLDKAEERLDRPPLLFGDLLRPSENVKHLTSYLAQTHKLLDKAKIPSSKLTSQQRQALLGHARTLNLIGVFQGLQIQKGYEGHYKAVNSWEQWLRNNSYDAAALREVSNRIDTLEKRIQKASDIAGGKKSVSKRKKKRDTKEKQKKTAQQWWERRFKGSVHVADQFVAEKFEVAKRTVENWRADWQKDGWKQPTKSDVKFRCKIEP